MRMKELLSKEYESRLKELVDKISVKEEELEEVHKGIGKIKAKAKERFAFGIEKKFNGFRAVIHKRSNDVKIFSDHKRDITFPFPTIINQVKKLDAESCILDCELVPHDKTGKPLGRNIAAKYIASVKSKKRIDDSRVKFYVFDCVYFNGESIAALPWFERKRILSRIMHKKQDNVVEVKPIVVHDETEAAKAVKLISKLRGSEGAMVKRYAAPYADEGSDGWIKFGTKLVTELKEKGEEGRETRKEIRDFPKRMLESLSKVKRLDKWMPFVLQWHYRGHATGADTQEMRSLHADFRMSVGSHLEGITLLSPASVDLQVADNLFKGKWKHVRCVVKMPQPTGWLGVEGVLPKGEPGTTVNADAVLSIIAKGEYKPVIVEDHKIVILTKSVKGRISTKPFITAKARKITVSRTPGALLRDLPEKISFHIAHIGERWIILSDELK